MIEIKRISCLCMAMLLAFTVGVLAQVEFSEQLFLELAQNVNEIPYIEIPDYHKAVLDNGITVYLVEDHQLPIVELEGYLMGGRSQENPQLPGVIDVMTHMMITGTANLDEYEFARFKALHGINLNMVTHFDHLQITADALSTDKEQLITLVADVLQNPDFSADYFGRIIQELYQYLAFSLYNAEQLSNMVFYSVLYAGHPYGTSYDILTMLQSFPSLTPEHLQDCYYRTVDPQHLVLIIVGDFSADEMLALVEDKFGSWASQGVELTGTPVIVDQSNYDRIILVNKPDATQGIMKMGINMPDHSFSERVAFMMANRVLGSGEFSCRLMNVLRSEKGYVYGVSSGVQYFKLGSFYAINTEVAEDKVWETRKIIKEQLELIKNGTLPISDEELFSNVNYFNAFFPQSYRHKIDAMSNIVYSVEALNWRENYLNELVAAYNQLTAEEAQAVFSKYVFPERFITVIVGNKDRILPAFIENGVEVEVIDLF